MAAARTSSKNTSAGCSGIRRRMRWPASWPMACHSWRRPQARCKASSRCSTVGAAARKPDAPSSSTSGIPATRVAITGRPHSMASTMASGSPSTREGRIKPWCWRQSASRLSVWPVKCRQRTSRSSARR